MNVDVGFGLFVFVACLAGFVHWGYARRADTFARHITGWDLIRTRQADPSLERARMLDLVGIAAVVVVLVTSSKFSVGVPEPPAIVVVPIVGALAATLVAGAAWVFIRARHSVGSSEASVIPSGQVDDAVAGGRRAGLTACKRGRTSRLLRAGGSRGGVRRDYCEETRPQIFLAKIAIAATRRKAYESANQP